MKAVVLVLAVVTLLSTGCARKKYTGTPEELQAYEQGEKQPVDWQSELSRVLMSLPGTY